MGYRGHPVLVWDALELRLLGFCQTEFENNGVDDMVFNPNPEIPALVVSYQDGSLCVFDYMRTATQPVSMPLQTQRSGAFAASLGCSPDGRSLAIGSNQGTIEVFAFERTHNGTHTALTPVYRTSHPLEEEIRGVSFSPDGRRLVDIRGQQGRVWAPAALVRKSDSEIESSVGSEAVHVFTYTSSPDIITLGDEEPEITSPLLSSPDREFILAGKSNGDVVVFSTADAAQVGVLYRHALRSAVVHLAIAALTPCVWIVASADDSGRVLVARVETPFSEATSKKPTTLLDRRFHGAVRKVILNPLADRVLACGRYTEQCWQISPDDTASSGASGEQTRPKSPETRPAPDHDPAAILRSVFQHPTNPEWYVAIMGDVARIYTWADSTEVTTSEGIKILRSVSPASPNDAKHSPFLPGLKISYHVGASFVVEHLRMPDMSMSRLYVWSSTAFDPAESTTSSLPLPELGLDIISPLVDKILEVTGTTIIFLDINLWVCSAELQSVSVAQSSLSSMPSSSGVSSTSPSSPLALRQGPSVAFHARRHFFALSEWRNAGGELNAALVSKSSSAGILARAGTISRDAVVIAYGHRIVVLKGGFEFWENVVAADPTESLAGRQHPHGGPNNGLPVGHLVWNVVEGSMHRRALNR